jgi:hypothetical protein
VRIDATGVRIREAVCGRRPGDTQQKGVLASGETGDCAALRHAGMVRWVNALALVIADEGDVTLAL